MIDDLQVTVSAGALPARSDVLQAIASGQASPWPRPTDLLSDIEGLTWTDNNYPTPDQVAAYTARRARPRWEHAARIELERDAARRFAALGPARALLDPAVTSPPAGGYLVDRLSSRRALAGGDR